MNEMKERPKIEVMGDMVGIPQEVLAKSFCLVKSVMEECLIICLMKGDKVDKPENILAGMLIDPEKAVQLGADIIKVATQIIAENLESKRNEKKIQH